MKRVFAVHDISGVGKCSLTVAVPIISACGIECNPVPTALLSTHTGEIDGYTFIDLTDNIKPYYSHWKTLGIFPDAIYTGYLGSEKQIEIVSEMIEEFRDSSPLLIIDPAMADNGKLYSGFNDSFVSKVRTLCILADVIVPNITEACLLTDTEFKTSYDSEYIELLVRKTADVSGRFVVLTGVSLEKDKTGCLVYDKDNDQSRLFTSERYPGVYYGTGDIFASVLTAMLVKGKDIYISAEKAVEFTSKSIHRTFLEKTDTRFGVAFEEYIKLLTDTED